MAGYLIARSCDPSSSSSFYATNRCWPGCSSGPALAAAMSSRTTPILLAKVGEVEIAAADLRAFEANLKVAAMRSQHRDNLQTAH